jgi:hypothetical protein
MVFSILLALAGLTLSAVAIYYSVIGLTAVFAAAFWPIVVMGTTLELSKLVAASWLKAYWTQIPRAMKIYMSTAVVVLMIITSMGIFGFLSKAHLDQNIVSGDVQSKIAIYDEKIKTAKENIDANRKALKQMDEAVDQVMGRSSDEKGAEKAVAIRRSQAKERARLQSEIATEQKTIAALSEERAPIAAEVRKVEAEVGPIKYIAKLIYGDNPDANLLEKAVTWVIMIIVFVFDPLAVLMLLGAQMTWKWHRERKEDEYTEMASDLYEVSKPIEEPQPEPVVEVAEKEHNDPHPVGWMFPKHAPIQDYRVEDADEEESVVEPQVDTHLPEKEKELEIVEEVGVEQWNKMVEEDKEEDFDIEEHARSYSSEEVNIVKERMRKWKIENPDSTIKEQRTRLELGMIDRLPWDEEPAEKKTYIVKDGSQQVVKTRDDTYVQNAEQNTETLWQKIQNKKAK